MTTMTTRKRRAMTLIDPDTRWWRTNRTRSLLAYLCIGLGLVAGFLGPLAIFNTDLDDSSWTPKWLAAGYITVAIPLIIAGTLIYGFGVDGDAKPRPVTWALPLYFIVTGAGCLIGAHWSGLAFGSARSFSSCSSPPASSAPERSKRDGTAIARRGDYANGWNGTASPSTGT